MRHGLSSPRPACAWGRVVMGQPEGTSLARGTLAAPWQPEGPTSEFTPESGALGVARCPSGALSGALIRASSGTVWSRDLQVSRGQWPSPGRARAARKSCLMSTFCVRRSAGDSAAATG